MSPSSSSDSIEYIVFGAGIIGLTTALELALRLQHSSSSQKSPKIAIVARYFPTDRPLDIGDPNTLVPQSDAPDAISAQLAGSFYCSPFAGANWDSFVTDTSQNGGLGYYEAATYAVWKELLREDRIDGDQTVPDPISRVTKALKSSLASSTLSRRDVQAEFIGKDSLKSIGIFTPESEPDAARDDDSQAHQISKDIWFNDLVGGVDVTFPTESKETVQDLEAVQLSIKFSSFILSPSHHLSWLAARLEDTGLVTFHHLDTPARSLAEVHSLYPSAHTLFNCSGLGARGLEDVQDVRVFPVRGDTIAVVPTQSEKSRVVQARNRPMLIQLGTRNSIDPTYVFPRGSPSSTASHPSSGLTLSFNSVGNRTEIVDVQETIILGGSRKAHVWHTHHDPHLETEILSRVARVRPEFTNLTTDHLGPLQASPTSVPSVTIPSSPPRPTLFRTRRRSSSLANFRFIVVPREIAGGTGLRPSREGGARLEAEDRQFGSAASRVRVVHNYGAGGAGFQMSWGMALEAVDLAGVNGAGAREEELNQKRTTRTVEDVTHWAFEQGRKEMEHEEPKL